MQNIPRHINNNTGYTGVFCVGMCLTEMHRCYVARSGNTLNTHNCLHNLCKYLTVSADNSSWKANMTSGILYYDQRMHNYLTNNLTNLTFIMHLLVIVQNNKRYKVRVF
jgi:hypothetical protein